MNEEDKDHRVWRERRPLQTKLRVILPVATIILGIGLYCSVLLRLQVHKPWTINNISHKPTSTFQSVSEEPSYQDQETFSIRLHPHKHIYRPARTVELEWNITKGLRRPDGVLKSVFLINGQFIGPTVEVRSGDELLITIINLLDDDESLAMHWHGLSVSNDMDGVPGLTQCAIRRDNGFQYRLTIENDQAGTFWYHSHSDTQRADGLYGPLIVHKPATSEMLEAEDEQVLVIGDFYHRPATTVLEEFTDWKSFKIEPSPDSILINGKGHFDCTMAVPARPVDGTIVRTRHLNLPGAGKTRLRLINTGSLTGVTFSLIGYAMTIITVDGGNSVRITSRTESVGILYPGERVDVIVECLDTSLAESGSLVVTLDHENMQFPNLALTAIQEFPILVDTDRQSAARGNPCMSKRQLLTSRVQKTDLSTLVGSELSLNSTLDIETKSILLYSTLSYLAINENRPKGYINHSSWTLPESRKSDSIPLLALEHGKWPSDPAPFIPTTDGATWVDIVINNMDDKGHPFHLHGNDFYILATHSPSRVGAYEFYNPSDYKRPIPLEIHNPLKKDTVYVPTMGYVVLRFKAEKLGLWLLHCHVLWHQSVGMATAIEVSWSGNEDFDVLMRAAMDGCNNK